MQAVFPENILTRTEELGDLSFEIVKVCEKQEENWRHEVVRIRRDMTKIIGDLGLQTIAWSPPEVLATLHREFRKSLSALRALLAEHQATWPAISLDPKAPDYVRSVKMLAAAYEHLHRYARQLQQHADARGE